jgi:hypothetical protein
MASPSCVPLRRIYSTTWRVRTIVNSKYRGILTDAFGWCSRDFALLGFGSISIVNSESKTSLDWAYDATCAGLYTLYDMAKLCGKESCGFCTQIKEQIEDKTGTFKTRLASEDATKLFFPLAKPSSDNPIHFF